MVAVRLPPATCPMRPGSFDCNHSYNTAHYPLPPGRVPGGCHEGDLTMADDFAFNPLDPAFFENPFPAYERMRHEFPVYKLENENPRVFPHYWMPVSYTHLRAHETR